MSAEIIQFREPRTSQPAIIDGRMPPVDIDAEAAVISSVLIDPLAIAKLDFLSHEHFYSERHRRIYEVAEELARDGKPIEVVTVGSILKDRRRLAQVGGMGYLTEVLNAAPAVRNVRHYGVIVHELARVRRTILLAQHIAAEGYGDVGVKQEWLDDAAASLAKIARMSPTKPLETQAEAYAEMASLMQQAGSPDRAIRGLKTGIHSLDVALRGMRPGQKITIAAMTGFGKTILAEQIASYAASQNVGVLYCLVADMAPSEIRARQLARLACVDSKRIEQQLSGEAVFTRDEQGRVMTAMIEAARWPFLAVRCKDASIDEIGALARRVQDAGIESSLRDGVRTAPLGMVVIDYIQSIARPRHMPKATLYEYLSYSTKQAKKLAEDLQVVVLEPAQGKTPDARAPSSKPSANTRVCQACGIIDDEANAIVYVWGDKKKTPNERTLMVLKGRGGGEGEIECDFDKEHARIVDRRDPGTAQSRAYVDRTPVPPPGRFDDDDGDPAIDGEYR